MKKGFTLIELLAVIVILAIIALIATPIILGIIEDARIGSIEASANGYIDAVEYQLARTEIKGETISDGTYDVHQLEIDLDGAKPTYGEVTIEKGKVSKVSLCIDGKKVELENNTPKVIGTCASLYNEELLNGADPVLKGELVPVNISSDGKVIKADVTKEWYSYKNKKWANAVTLMDDGKIEEDGEIKEESIKEYYVWIPRYAYKLWNVNSDNTENAEKPIEIIFGSKAKTTGENNGDMYLHPAFTNFDTQGIWVGKFELSYNEETFIDSNTFLSVNPNTVLATDSSELIIKPNVRGLGNKTVSQFHTLIYNSHRNLNSHMITNMEWGAAAYLTYSIYGRCDSDSCEKVLHNNTNTGNLGSEIKFTGQNMYGASITGCAANNFGDNYVSNVKECDNPYNNEKGYLASTTGNITGIYDMSGGSLDYVMGVLSHSNGTIFSGYNSDRNSGFKGFYSCPTCYNNTSGLIENTTGLDIPNKKYYNAYKNNNSLETYIWYDYSEGMLGDATKEIANTKSESTTNQTGNWFGESAIFVTATDPWLSRGNAWDGTDKAGIMAFNGYGLHSPSYSHSTRAVLAFK